MTDDEALVGMTSSGRCHGPGCTRTADGDFCGEKCAWAWQQQHADHTPPGATIQIEWTHPHLGRIIEHVCEKHEQVVLRALRALGIGCSGCFFDASSCLRCDNDGERPRNWLPSCAVPEDLPVTLDGTGTQLPPASSAYPQVASTPDPMRGWLHRALARMGWSR